MPIKRMKLPCKPKGITNEQELRSENQFLKIWCENQVKLASNNSVTKTYVSLQKHSTLFRLIIQRKSYIFTIKIQYNNTSQQFITTQLTVLGVSSQFIQVSVFAMIYY
ncbi:Hypothetical_protein [Hexamita inflata]|uniref:Hypothetical_protein n=1 Tax=Hexamita inflata TaxID=28002 RepID=A0AA86PDB6_9EUKA|nr:Hypothetical protein HINF_LOCUS24056 [Hexamita inflata]CAI9936412.1 Hypothetical protein HINF_LOCUS24057 [Hexamita inflata]CAI9936413.1 Hypothetical protein HINF_LOCUS24058 [Hexamita inflata]CAI9936414.1 Hypothetical protein HINF_LOCUS24059 [Hexamita inflata]